jgi:hypothetical protein
MRSRRNRILLLAAIGLCSSLALRAETWRNHFDADGAFRPPGFFDFKVLVAPGDAKWMVLSDPNPPSAPNQLTQTIVSRPDGSIAAALRRNVGFRDGKVTVEIKKIPSRAGLILRFQGEKDFLALLVDQVSGEAKLTSWRSGKPTVLAQGKTSMEGTWGLLVVRLAGDSVEAAWNDRALLSAKDPRPASGSAGMATEGAGNASFDEFVIESP